MWINAIELAEKHEKDWREAAEKVVKRYRMEGQQKSNGFPILYANTETLLPAVYNSVPVADVRRRFGDADEAAKTAAQALERAISHSCDEYDFHQVMCDAVKDMGLPGRGVTRVRYEPLMGKDGESIAYQKVTSEPVDWREVTFGPAKRWSKLPWVKFDHLLTREQLVKLSPKHGEMVPLTHTCDGHEEKKGEENKLPDIFKRGLVWEIWDKDAREVRWLAPHFKAGFLREDKDPLRLEGFYPIPRPLYAIWTTDSLVPIEPFRVYAAQADELDDVTRRIMALIKVCRVRGIYDPALAQAFELLKSQEDGEYQPAEGGTALREKALDQAIWDWPLDKIVVALKQLYENREQIKAVIFELTGIADIMRGQTEAQETKGAQQLKTQWGTLRISPLQQEVQRYARDLIRLKAEIIAEHFLPQTLEMITGIKLPPEVPAPQQMGHNGGPPMGQPEMVPNPVLALLKTDALRSYKIDIETDSTIRADVQRSQEQIARFVEGSGAFFTAMAPAVEAGVMSKPAAVTLYTSFARQFKLGKDAEDALDSLLTQAEQEAQAGPQQDPEQAKLAAEQQKMQMEAQLKQAELQANLQAKQAELDLKRQEAEMNLEVKRQEMELQAQQHQQQLAMQSEQHQADMTMRSHELQLKEREGQMNAQLEAAKIADGQMARQEERVQKDAISAGLPEGQKAMDFMGETGNALKVATEQLNTLAQALSKANEMIADLKAQADAPAEVVRGPDGKVAGIKRGNVVKMAQRGADGRVTGVA